MNIDEQTKVRDIVVSHPETRRVLEGQGIDYCCGGNQTLLNAAKSSGKDVSDVLDKLHDAVESASATAEGRERSWGDADLTDLVDHIEATHHVFMKEALPRVERLLQKVLNAHGAAHGPMLRELQAVFSDMRIEIESHLRKEEQVLFPYIRQLRTAGEGGGELPAMHCGSIQNPIRQMESEHEDAGGALVRMRAITDNYTLPDDACPTFAALYDALKEIEDDLHLHIHLENNILFPRALTLVR